MAKILEQEFTTFVKMHKVKVIITALVIYENEGIYNCQPLEDYDLSYMTGIKKAKYVIRDLFRRGIYDDVGSYYLDETYEICWEKLPSALKDNVDLLLEMILSENHFQLKIITN